MAATPDGSAPVDAEDVDPVGADAGSVTVIRTARAGSRKSRRWPPRLIAGVMAVVVVLVVAGVVVWSLARPPGLAGPRALADVPSLPQPGWSVDLIKDGEQVTLQEVVPVGEGKLLAVLTPTAYFGWDEETDAVTGEQVYRDEEGNRVDPSVMPAQGGLVLLDGATGDVEWTVSWSDMGASFGSLVSLSGSPSGGLVVSRAALTDPLVVTVSTLALPTGAVTHEGRLEGVVPLNDAFPMMAPVIDDETEPIPYAGSEASFSVMVNDLQVPQPVITYGAGAGDGCTLDAVAPESPGDVIWSAEVPDCVPVIISGSSVLGLIVTSMEDSWTVTSASDIRTGSPPAWFPATGDASWTVPLGDTVVVGRSAEAGGFDAELVDGQGRRRWRSPLPAAPIPAGGGLVVRSGSRGGGPEFSRVDPASGRLLWTVPLETTRSVWNEWEERFVATDDVIVVEDASQPKVRLLDAATGVDRAEIDGWEVWWAGEKVVYGTDGAGNLAAWDADGQSLWTLPGAARPCEVPGRFIVADPLLGDVTAYS